MTEQHTTSSGLCAGEVRRNPTVEVEVFCQGGDLLVRRQRRSPRRDMRERGKQITGTGYQSM